MPCSTIHEIKKEKKKKITSCFVALPPLLIRSLHKKLLKGAFKAKEHTLSHLVSGH